ncbi:MAG: LysR family transcriptional regulator [Betaproteobacteria bacterium]|nr:MAG: LysR family transcriptional regulator [Betaproteobacteria bacterium]
MDIRQIETFVWIARLGSIAEACKRLNATQSTLSMRLKTLEESLNVSLFDRAHKRLTLTAKGRDLARYAEKILELIEQVRFYVADPKAAFGTVRVGATELIALTWAPDLIRRINAQFPQVLFDLEVGLTLSLMDGLADGKLDAVLVPTLHKPVTPLTGVSLGTVTFSWMASPALGLGGKRVTPGDLQELAIIGASAQSIFHSLVDQWFTDHGAAIQRLNVCNSLTASISMTVAGVGVSLLPDQFCIPYVKRRQLEILRANRRFDLEFYAIYSARGERPLPRLVAELAQSISTFPRVQVK